MSSIVKRCTKEIFQIFNQILKAHHLLHLNNCYSEALKNEVKVGHRW